MDVYTIQNLATKDSVVAMTTPKTASRQVTIPRDNGLHPLSYG